MIEMESKIHIPKMYTIDEIKQIVVPIAQKHGVKKLALFGSYARGEQMAESDLDFIMEPPDKYCGFEFYGFLDEFEEDLENGLGLDVDTMTYRGLKDSYLFNEIDAEVVLYEAK